MTDQAPDSTSGRTAPSSRNKGGSSHGPSPSLGRKLLGTAAAATLLAICVHAYLLKEHYGLRFGEASGSSMCNINELFSCAAVSASKYSEFLGVPMALWGIVANTVLLLLIAFYPMAEENRKPAAARNVVLVSGFIAATSIVMGSISAILVSKLCPFCMIAYLLSFITFAAAWIGLRAAMRPKGNQDPFRIKDFTTPVVLTGIGFLAAIIGNDTILKNNHMDELAPLIAQSLDIWKTSPVLNFTPVAALVTGASDDKAKMVVTEFADFRCSHCRAAAPVMRAFVAANPDVQLRFEAWPLDSECNTTIPGTPNGASCLLARAVNCAESLSHNGWKAHEYIYEHQESLFTMDAIRAGMSGIASAAGTPLDQFQACADSPEAKALISKEAAVGSALNLNGTPSVFVNNKKLPYGQLLQILNSVHREIQATN